MVAAHYILVRYKETFFHHLSGLILEQANQRDCTIFILGDIQDSDGQNPKQPDLIRSVLTGAWIR